MKKTSIIAFFLCIFFFSFQTVNAVYRPGWSYWDNWKKTYTKFIPQTEAKENTFQNSLRYPYPYNKKNTTREKRFTTRSNWSFSGVPRQQQGSFNTQSTQAVKPHSQTSVYDRLRERFLKMQEKKSVYSAFVSVQDLAKDLVVTEIDKTVHPVFHVGISNKTKSSLQEFRSALSVREIQLEMLDKTGIAQNPEDFELVVNQEQAYSFEKDGSVTLNLKNARMAQNDTLDFEFGIRIKNPDFVPHQKGSFRLRVSDVSVVQENTEDSVSVVLSGQRMSSYVGINPTIAQTTGTQNIRGQTETIYGRRLSAGSSAIVLKARFSAAYDDLNVEEVVLTDTLSRGHIDSFASEIVALSEETGSVLGRGRFINGQARIRFHNPIKIYRNGQEKSVLFEIHIAKRVQTEYDNFKLKIDPRSIKVSSASTGRDLGDTYKNVNLESDIFTVSETGGSFFLETPDDQKGFAVLQETAESVFRFKMINNDRKDISIARITMDVRLNGLDFANGRSADDYQLRRIYNGREVDPGFQSTLSGDSLVVFDTDNPVFIPKNTTFEYVLKLKLEDIVSGSAKYDSVLVELVDDSALKQGTVADLKAQNMNFIWTDQGNKKEWSSGFLIKGLSSGFVSVSRK